MTFNKHGSFGFSLCKITIQNIISLLTLSFSLFLFLAQVQIVAFQQEQINRNIAFHGGSQPWLLIGVNSLSFLKLGVLGLIHEIV